MRTIKVDPAVTAAEEKYSHGYALMFSIDYENDSYIDGERYDDVDKDSFSYAYSELLKALESNFNRYKKELSEIFETTDILIISEDTSYGYYSLYPEYGTNVNIYYNGKELPYEETVSKLEAFINKHPDLLDIYGDYNDSYTDGDFDGGAYYDSSLGGWLPSERTYRADINIGAYIESFEGVDVLY